MSCIDLQIADFTAVILVIRSKGSHCEGLALALHHRSHQCFAKLFTWKLRAIKWFSRSGAWKGSRGWCGGGGGRGGGEQGCPRWISPRSPWSVTGHVTAPDLINLGVTLPIVSNGQKRCQGHFVRGWTPPRPGHSLTARNRSTQVQVIRSNLFIISQTWKCFCSCFLAWTFQERGCRDSIRQFRSCDLRSRAPWPWQDIFSDSNTVSDGKLLAWPLSGLWETLPPPPPFLCAKGLSNRNICCRLGESQLLFREVLIWLWHICPVNKSGPTL